MSAWLTHTRWFSRLGIPVAFAATAPWTLAWAFTALQLDAIIDWSMAAEIVQQHDRLTIVAAYLVAWLMAPMTALAQTTARLNGPYVAWSATRACLLQIVTLSPLGAVALAMLRWRCCPSTSILVVVHSGDLRLDHASSGQRRRVELIAHLAGDPAVLLLDEVLTHLDAYGVQTLLAWLSSWRETRTVLWVHHGELPLKADHTWVLGAEA
jgi:hypothetical protein